jgi:hypothetical protein
MISLIVYSTCLSEGILCNPNKSYDFNLDNIDGLKIDCFLGDIDRDLSDRFFALEISF